VQTAEQVWLLYVLTAIQLAFSGVFFPARNAIIPNIVSRSELGAANAISTTTWSVMLSLGAAIGGLVAGQWGNYPAFVVDSISFFLSAYFISHVQYTHEADESSEPAEAGGQIAAAFRQYVDGLKYLKDHKDIFAITLHKSAVSLLANGAFQVIQVTLAQQVFVMGENGSTSLGLMYAVAGIGTGVGPILARVFTGDRDRPLRHAITIAYLLAVIGLALTAPLTSFTLVLVGTFIRMLGGGINWTFSTQLLLEWVPDKVRGRVFSSEFAMFTLANAISSATGGWLLDNTDLGISGIVWWMTGLMIVPGILWFAWTTFGNTNTTHE
jgi:predicted MFS family arabinose efflux permease